MYKVSPHGKLPLPNNEYYNNDREFFQEEGLQRSFEIDLSDVIGMEVDNEREVDEEGGDEVQNIQDLQLLERLRLGRDSEDDIPPSDSAGYVDIADSDDEDYDPANPDYDDYFLYMYDSQYLIYIMLICSIVYFHLFASIVYLD